MDYRVDRAETPVGKVLLDTCILIPSPIRDWILILAYKSNEMDIPLFTPCVSSWIMDEFGYRMARNGEVIKDAELEAIKTRILSNSERIAGFEVKPIDDFPDINDLHLHAAAEFGGVDFLRKRQVLRRRQVPKPHRHAYGRRRRFCPLSSDCGD